MNKFKFFIIFIFFVLGGTKTAFAITVYNQENVEVNKNIEENLIIVGKQVKITGHVNGDIFCLAEQSLDINGQVDGDIVCLSRTVNISGQINGSVKIIGYNINVNGTIAHSLAVLGKKLLLNEGSIIKKDILFLVQKAVIKGKIGRDLEGRGLDIFIKGNIGRNVDLNVINNSDFNLNISNDSYIGGNLKYLAPHKVDINPDIIKGNVIYKKQKIDINKNFNIFTYGMSTTISVFSALVLGLVLVSFWCKQIKIITDQMLSKIFLSFVWGALFVFIFPLLSFFLLFTIIGFSLSIAIVLFWLLILLFARVFVGILIGRSLLDVLCPSKKDSMIWAMILGVVILWILFSLPLIGSVFSLLSLIWGAGALLLYLRSTIEDNL